MVQIYGGFDVSSTILLTWALEKELGFRSCPTVAKTGQGKPYFPHFPGLYCSLTHSGTVTLWALGDSPVGIDAEWIHPRRPSLPQYAFTEKEFQLYRQLGENWPAFYTVWTRKEAWCKYTGMGLAASWREAPPQDGVRFQTYPNDGWCATLCCSATPPSHILWLPPQERNHLYGCINRPIL